MVVEGLRRAGEAAKDDMKMEFIEAGVSLQHMTWYTYCSSFVLRLCCLRKVLFTTTSNRALTWIRICSRQSSGIRHAQFRRFSSIVCM